VGVNEGMMEGGEGRTHLEPELAKHPLFKFRRGKEILRAFLEDEHVHNYE